MVAVTGRTLSALGDEMALVAFLLHAAVLGAGSVTAVLVVAAVPFVVVGPWAGRLVDRSDSRALTSLAGAVAAVGIAAMAVGVHAGLPLAVLLAAFAVVQCAQAVAGPAWGALVPRIVGEERAAAQSGVQQMLNSVTRLIGPVLGGLLVAAAGAAGAFTVDAVTFALLGAGGLAVRTRRRPGRVVPSPAGATGPSGGAGPGPSEVGGGLRLVAANPVVGPLLTVLAGFIVGATATNVTEVLLVTGVLGGGAVSFGAVGTAVGVGVVAGSLAARRVRSDRGRVVGVCGCAVLIGLLSVAEGLAPTLSVAAALFTVSGMGNGMLSSCFGQVLVARTPDAERGRVFAAVASCTETATILGLALGGILTTVTSPRATYVATGVATAVGTLAIVAVTRHRLTSALGAGPTAAPIGSANPSAG